MGPWRGSNPGRNIWYLRYWGRRVFREREKECVKKPSKVKSYESKKNRRLALTFRKSVLLLSKAAPVRWWSLQPDCFRLRVTQGEEVDFSLGVEKKTCEMMANIRCRKLSTLFCSAFRWGKTIEFLDAESRERASSSLLKIKGMSLRKETGMGPRDG